MSGLFGFITWEMFWAQGVVPISFFIGIIALTVFIEKMLEWAWKRLLKLNVYLKSKFKNWHGRPPTD